ncbi:ABC transporter substrate-binding protein [Spirillospora sp. NPDC048819]|uniref:ABC transporter substrate-binding protein n=1 Tax=Spirillospora sp. NPDC048819 TaxID=3155268 RepID=UPI0033DD83CB
MTPILALARLRAGRLAAVALTGALALTACGGTDKSGAAGADAVSIAVAASKGSIPGLPPIVAQETGIFAKHGLDVELITSLRGGAAIMSALTSGSADVVAQTVSAGAKAKQSGASLPLISAQSAGVPYILVAGPKTKVPPAKPGPEGWQETIRSLKGATIAASGPGTAFDVILKGLFHDVGLADTDFSNVNIAHGGPEVAALKTGQVDAVVADIGTALSLIDEAGGQEVLDMAKIGPQWLTDQAWSGFMTSQKTLDAKPELAAKWAAAMTETREFMQNPANLKELHRIAVQVSGIPDNDQLDQALTRFGKLLLPSFTTAQVQTTIDYMTKSGQLTETPKVIPAELVAPGVIAADG